jgi:ribonuclease P protein component
VRQQFRLKSTAEFKRVRRDGKSFAHPLIVLIFTPSTVNTPRIGIAAGRRLGNAVTRNRVKRRLRAAVSAFLPKLANRDILLIARDPILNSSFDEITIALDQLFNRAGLYKQET